MELTFADSILVARPAEQVWDVVSDVTRTGQWSPICRACWWDEGGGPRVGAWFTGRNETPDRTWETRARVTVADRGREFSFEVGDGLVRWSWHLDPHALGTLLTQSWEFLPAGLELFATRYGEQAQAQIADRTAAAHEGIPVSLRAVRHLIEAG